MKINLNKNQRLGILLIVIIAGGFGTYFIGDYVGLWSVGPTPVTPTTKATSTFTLIDYRTGEDVTHWVEISVWTPDPDDLPFDEDDAYAITNFDEEEQSQSADSVAIDLRDHAVAWLEIDPDFQSDYGGYNGVYNALTTRDMRKIIGGANYDYYFYVYHAPSNVSIAVLEQGPQRSGSNIGDLSPYNNTFVLIAGSSFLRGTDGNYTVYLNMPYGSTDAYHAGITGQDEWDIDNEELTDMIEAAQAHYLQGENDLDMIWLQDQSNHRSITPYYDITDDDAENWDSDLERLTNAFAIRLGFNASVSETDGNRLQVNVTVMDRDYKKPPIEIIYSSEYIYLVFYEAITCYDDLYNVDLEIEFADHIWMGNVTTVRLEAPDDDDNLGTATAMNTAWLINYAKCG